MQKVSMDPAYYRASLFRVHKSGPWTHRVHQFCPPPEYSDGRIFNTRALKDLYFVYLSITPPDLSMMLVWIYSVEPVALTF